MLAQKIIKLQRKQSNTRGQAEKSFSSYIKRHQIRLRKKSVTDCQATLAFLGLYNMVAIKVEVFNHSTQQYETSNLMGEGEELKICRTETLTDKEIDSIDLLLCTKDRFVSNEAYYDM